MDNKIADSNFKSSDEAAGTPVHLTAADVSMLYQACKSGSLALLGVAVGAPVAKLDIAKGGALLKWMADRLLEVAAQSGVQLEIGEDLQASFDAAQGLIDQRVADAARARNGIN